MMLDSMLFWITCFRHSISVFHVFFMLLVITSINASSVGFSFKKEEKIGVHKTTKGQGLTRFVTLSHSVSLSRTVSYLPF